MPPYGGLNAKPRSTNVVIHLAIYLRQYVPTFQGIELVGPGRAYHYTVHADKITQRGMFLGAALSTELDHTQSMTEPNIAACDPGVVFAYEALAEAAEEGDNAGILYSGTVPEVFELCYSAGVRATHIQELQLDAPPTILISSSEITSFKRLGKCRDHYDENYL